MKATGVIRRIDDLGRLVIPKEIRKNLRIKEDNLEEVRSTLSQCFGDNASEVKAFMEKNMFMMDYVRLQIYLTQGQSGLDNYEKRLDRFMDKEMDKVMEKQSNV